MRTKNIVIYSIVVGILFLQSCVKLDMAPTDSIDPSKAFRNLDDVNMGVLGAYAPMTHTLIEIGGIVSDEVMLPTENTVSNTTAHRWQYNSSAGSVTSAFYEYYVVISRVNIVLEALSNLEVLESQRARKDQYEGELLALRAFCHFELLRAYASSYDGDGMGVPYMERHELIYPTRPTVAENFEAIKADLTAARGLIPGSFDDHTRITSTAVAAIQARVALYEKDWESAIDYANEVINQEPLAPKNDFPRIWLDQSDSEVIWKLARVIGDSRMGGSYFREAGEIVLYAPSFKLIETFGSQEQRENDLRFASYIQYDPARQAASGGVRSAYLVQKYVGDNSSYPGLSSVKLFRTGEMYLIRAEARLESDQSATGLAAAMEDLNTLRSARIHDYVHMSYPTKEQLLDAIYVERFKELAFEGHRFYDLKRRNLPIERSTQDAINTSGAIKLNPSDAQYNFPIPEDEIAINKEGMKQNPGYSALSSN